jgi:hypothetical protein
MAVTGIALGRVRQEQGSERSHHAKVRQVWGSEPYGQIINWLSV